MKKFLIFAFVFLLCGKVYADNFPIAAPVSNWEEVVANAESATTSPFNPSTVIATNSIKIEGKTGAIFSAQYTAAMGTDPIILAFGCDGTVCVQLADSDGVYKWTLSDKANDDGIDTTDSTDGTNYWTVTTPKIDALGHRKIVVTVQTAGVSASGTIKIIGKTY